MREAFPRAGSQRGILMKKILLLATGGTIASRPTAAGGLAPAITSEELLACVPELADLCEVSAVQVFNLDSTNVGPAQLQSIVRCIKENYEVCVDGVVTTRSHWVIDNDIPIFNGECREYIERLINFEVS